MKCLCLCSGLMVQMLFVLVVHALDLDLIRMFVVDCRYSMSLSSAFVPGLRPAQHTTAMYLSFGVHAVMFVIPVVTMIYRANLLLSSDVLCTHLPIV